MQWNSYILGYYSVSSDNLNFCHDAEHYHYPRKTSYAFPVNLHPHLTEATIVIFIHYKPRWLVFKISYKWSHMLSFLCITLLLFIIFLRFIHFVVYMCAKSLELCLTVCGPIDYSLPGSSVHWILQARILEWVAMPSSRGSSQPRNETWISLISCIDRWVLYHWVTWEVCCV